MSQSVSLLGCGWLGIALASSLLQRGLHVRGSTTHSSRVASLASLGIEPFLLRVDPDRDGESVGVGTFFSSETLVINLPPEISLGADYHLGQIESILSFIEQAPRRPTRLLYVSSTSVYGSRQGRVDETILEMPEGDSGEVLLRAEQKLSDFARNSHVGLTIVRPGGLIGPGRHPGLFLAGRKGVRDGAAPVNMIHQLDLADLMASLIVDHPTPAGECEIYNAVSNHHPTREEFYTRAARAIGVEPPSFSLDVSSETTGERKIVVADKIRRVTGCQLRFDDLFSAIGAR